MALIQRPDVALKLRDRYGLTSLPDSILATELVPVTIVDDLTDVGRARACQGRTTSTSGVGDFASTSIGHTDPVSSDIIIHLTRAFVASDKNALIHGVRLNQPAVGTLNTTKLYRDFKVPGQPSAQLLIDGKPAFPSRVELFTFYVPVFESRVVPLDIFINPGDRPFSFLCNASNALLEVSFEWDEIPPT